MWFKEDIMKVNTGKLRNTAENCAANQQITLSSVTKKIIIKK